MGAERRADFAAFGIGFDNYYTTHSEENRRLTVRMYEALRDAGHIARRSVRQAYDDFAQPARLVAELALLPVVLTAALARAWGLLGLLALAVILVAESGRRLGRTRSAVSAAIPLWAPAWVAERAVTVWLAAIHRARGGIGYAGRRIFAAATPVSLLRSQLSPRGGIT